MLALRCPRCGHGGQLPNVPREAAVKCRQCGTIFQAHSRRWLFRALLVLPVFLLLGAGSALLFHLRGRSPETTPMPGDDPGHAARATEPIAAVDLAAARQAAEARAERERLDGEQRALEALRDKLNATKANLERERQGLEKQDRDFQDRKAKLAKEQAELQATAARVHPAVMLKPEELERTAEKHLGQFVVCEGAAIQGKVIEKYKELDRYTVTVVSRGGGTFYSRVPLNGLFFSTTERIALALPRLLNNEGTLTNIRLYCEMRKFEKKSAGKALPEAHIYRLELFTTSGDHAKVIE